MTGMEKLGQLSDTVAKQSLGLKVDGQQNKNP
jgi:hypothetical protein